MTSDHTPGRPTARRRMAGYTPLAAPPGVPGTDSVPTSTPDTQEPSHASPPVPAAARAAELKGQHPRPATDPAGPASSNSPITADSPAAADNRAAADPAAPATTAPVPPARKRRMGGAPAPVEAPSAAATSTQDAGGAAPAETAKDGTPTTRMGGAPASAPNPSAVQTKAADPGAGRNRMGSTGSAASPAAASAAAPPAATSTPVGTATAPTARSGNRMAAPAPAGAGPATTPATKTPATGPDAGGTGQPAAGRPAWVKPAAIVAGLLVVAAAVVLGARWLRALEGVQQFITTYDGHASQPASAPEGIPAWMGWQHFLNMFFIVLIIRTGLQVRTERKPPGYWMAKKNSFFAPKGNTPKKVSLSQWLHQCMDVLWVANGLVFVVLLFATGQWMRIVPTDWDIVPNIVSGAIQYASLDWPTENGWVHYNALQVMAYFVTVFIAAPLAILSGIRFSTWWPEKAEWLNRIYPVEWARAVHFPVMLYFVGFTIVHVFLVFFTGALRNLNHMYTSRDVVDWWGLVVFLASLAVVAAAWFLTQPLFTTPIATRMGKVTK
jgi:thiosulfate reductase cytochrome b subunit